MSNAPIHEIDLKAFWKDPYPALKEMRQRAPFLRVPQLGATLMLRRDDIYENEKKIEVFSSDQPNGLMTVLMGQNMMRKDGKAHRLERKAIFPAVSPKTVAEVWRAEFARQTDQIIDEIEPLGRACMVKDIAMRISGEALKSITGLTNITWREMDRVSQGMIDGCANYQGDVEVERNCRDCTSAIDRYIDEMIPALEAQPDHSLLSVQMRSGLPEEATRANIKLAISGGQNEPRDAIAGAVWALLTHPDQLTLIHEGKATREAAFNEYTRWISPIGMSPRRVAKPYVVDDVVLEEDDRVFLMFGSGNRDERVFSDPDHFIISRDTTAAISFGAGPHFCAGAWASKCLIAEIALPMLFDRLSGLRLAGETPFGGWAFRGPLSMPVEWDPV